MVGRMAMYGFQLGKEEVLTEQGCPIKNGLT